MPQALGNTQHFIAMVIKKFFSTLCFHYNIPCKVTKHNVSPNFLTTQCELTERVDFKIGEIQVSVNFVQRPDKTEYSPAKKNKTNISGLNFYQVINI
jgi:hypothetical protein